MFGHGDRGIPLRHRLGHKAVAEVEKVGRCRQLSPQPGSFDVQYSTEYSRRVSTRISLGALSLSLGVTGVMNVVSNHSKARSTTDFTIMMKILEVLLDL